MSKSSFFTVPGAQRKRKRDVAPASSSLSKRGRSSAKPSQPVPRDESISGSDSEDDDDDEMQGLESGSGDESSDNEGETEAERRLRLAERYLKNVQNEVELQTGFDAADVDRDIIAERLIEDVAENKGRMYRYIAADFDYAKAESTQFRFEKQTECITGVAVCPPYAYTVSKDITITKWELPSPAPAGPPAPTNTKKSKNPKKRKPPPPPRRRPTKLLRSRGDHRKVGDTYYKHHSGQILCVAASADGKFLVTGGADKKIVVWNPVDLKPIRFFSHHRGAVTSLAFRRGTNQLYSASADRTIKIWSLDDLAYVETLFGHQDEVVDVAALAQERCLTAGARDRTLRLWKVVEETQLVFRGGGSNGDTKSKGKGAQKFGEGSIDRVTMIDDEIFVSGSDNGSLALWSLTKKKPLFVIPQAHGLDPPPKKEDADPDGKRVFAPPSPRWITALASIPYSDVILSGSWDGQVRAWKVTEDKKKLEPVGILGRDLGIKTVLANGELNGHDAEDDDDNDNDDDMGDDENQKSKNKSFKPLPCARGVVNSIDVFERGKDKDAAMCVVVALGKEHRLGRWKRMKGRNGAMVFEIPRMASSSLPAISASSSS